MSKPRVWRDSNDYRSEYFRKSPGLLGFIWFCSQCGKPLFGKGNVQVDHIFPPSKLAVRKVDRKGNLKRNTSILAEAANTSFNTAAICEKCNKKKSNKIGLVTGKGIIAKLVEVILFNAQKVLVLLFAAVVKLLYFFIRMIWMAITKPLTAKQPWYLKVSVYCIYFVFIYYVYKQISS